MAQRDLYSVLGVDKKASAERDQEGLPQARAPVPPRPQPGRQAGRGALQGDLRGLRHPRRRGQAQAVRPRRHVRAAAAAGRGARRLRRRAPSRDILSNLFGGGGGGGAGRTGTRGPRAERGRDLEAEVSISFEQSVEGAQIPLTVPTSQRCGTCHGTGAKPGTSPKVCPRCQGRGIESQGQGLFSISQPCSRCGGTGAIIEDPCPTCEGAGSVRTVKKYRVNIPAGVRDGSRVRLAGKGEPGRNGGPAGDLYVITRVSREPGLQAQGRPRRGRGPAHDPRGDPRAPRSRCRRSAGARSCASPPGPSTAPSSACAARARRAWAARAAGDIHYRFVIDVPASLSDEQSEAVEKLSQVMNGNPRARLFSHERQAPHHHARHRRAASAACS